MTPVVQLRTLAAADLRAELRGGDVLYAVVPFAATGLLLIAMAVGADTPVLRRIAPGVYWAVVVLFGCLVALRDALADVPERRDLLLLLGVDPVVSWTARAATTALLLLAVEAVLAPVVVVLYDPPVRGLGSLAGALVLVAVGLAALGTLAADLAAGARARGWLVPLVVVPLTLPLVLGAVQLHDAATYAASPWPWLALGALVDVVAVLAGLLTARPLQEALR